MKNFQQVYKLSPHFKQKIVLSSKHTGYTYSSCQKYVPIE